MGRHDGFDKAGLPSLRQGSSSVHHFRWGPCSGTVEHFSIAPAIQCGGETKAPVGYHEKLPTDELLPATEEKKLPGALIGISTGIEDVSKINVPAEVGRRLIKCHDELRKD
ncbi:MAG TPA: hypothetical protein VHY91_26595 [Pirellulales bacterium]|nr:hypothetical protein [Pirellulales bacterium]